MSDDESFDEFYAKLNDVINFAYNLGEIYDQPKIVRKILRSLTENFRPKVIAIIQLTIERVKRFILTHFQLLKPSGQHLQLGVFNFLRSLVCGLQYLSCLLGNGNVRNPMELIWRHATKNSVKCFAISI